MSGRVTDDNGYALMVGDSHSASQHFGFDGIGLRNVPKSKFMFYVKFQRARSQGGSAWERGLGIVAKSLDRPRIAFRTETLNQYNRKRVIQTGHDLEALTIKFHDTVLEDVQRMFEEYYAYYFYDQDAYADPVINDVVKEQMDPANPFGYKASTQPDGFFSHITVYQIFNKSVSIFELINPKIDQYNPDDLDYAQHDAPNEILLQVAFEGITYRGIAPFDQNIAEEMGLDATLFYDIAEAAVPPPSTFTAGGPVGETADFDAFGALNGTLLGAQTPNINGFLGGNSNEDIIFRSLSGDSLNTFDKAGGVATAQLPLGGFEDLLKGDSAGDTDLNLPIYGSPLDDLF